MSPNAWRAVLDITLTGTWFMTREFGRRHLAAGTAGSIVSVGASYAWTGGPGYAHSAAAKAGVKNLVETLAVEWGPYGIRINGLVPGLMPHEDMTADIRGHLDRTGETDRGTTHASRRYGSACRANWAGRRRSWPRRTPGSSPDTRSWSTARTGSGAPWSPRPWCRCASSWAAARSRHPDPTDGEPAAFGRGTR
ncbi:SDR family oxidoreductase [Streptomyces brevispora]|uniref:Peroxisomal trans-2-enoyl-CoA reductase n=1 Tax=Streptomyces brevispora TaxID=887462 RepID=A0ABZ1FW52_9ACTN|nr:SDR family oxidoreductase [Streptomyces brevispora]WSC11730.1 SDR family oxidoreductase [Streptomyces brevispora]